MAPLSKSPDLAQDSRPPSVFTNDSVFADSAISVGASTPKLMHHDDQLEMASTTSDSAQPTLSERFSVLAASAFAMEECTPSGYRKQKQIREALRSIESCMSEPDGGDEPDLEVGKNTESTKDTEETLEEIQLHEIHASLAATVSAMRQRQQEQRHLHQLTIQKLEAVAQTCIVQQQQLQDFERDMASLRQENQNLGQENDSLRDQITALESHASQKEVAVKAMSTAVAGLEGWINNSPGAEGSKSRSITQSPRRGRIVVRGKGRFRGRYFVDDPDGEVVLNGPDTTASEATDLQDGVKSWLRGFRDVEEELHRASSPRVIRSRVIRSDLISEQDDWGEFETVSGAG